MKFNNREQRNEEKHSGARNIIGKGTTMQGDLETLGNTRLEGKMIGNLKTTLKLIVGHSSEVEGSVIAQNADVEGQITGNIEVSEVLTLKSTAVINGNILTNKLVVETGAVFNGRCKMGVTMKEIKIGGNGKEEPVVLKAPDLRNQFNPTNSPNARKMA